MEELAERDCRGEFDLYFLDEVGFSVTPTVPHGWQSIGETIAIPSSKGGSVRTLGFMSLDCKLQAYNAEGTIDASAVVALMDHFVSTRKARLAGGFGSSAGPHGWPGDGTDSELVGTRGGTVLPTPVQSRIKSDRAFVAGDQAKWLPLEAYTSFDSLKRRLDEVLGDIGTNLKLNFAMAAS